MTQLDGSNTWILDSGASRHMVLSRLELIKAKPLDIPIIVVLRDGESLKETHQGEATISPNVRLTDNLYVRGLKENLFLVSIASAISGNKIVMENGLCQVMKNGRFALSAKKKGIFWIMATLVTEPEGEGNVLVDYNCRCRHTDYRTIYLMCKTGILPSIKEQRDHTNNFCHACLKGKMTRTVIPKLSNLKTRKQGESIHSNLCGPMKTRSIKGNMCIVIYLDNKTK